jgi:hypothetical protein
LAQKIIGRVVGYYLVGDFYGEALEQFKLDFVDETDILPHFRGSWVPKKF